MTYRSWFVGPAAFVVIGFVGTPVANAQVSRPDPFGWRTIAPESTKYDEPGIFTLHFRFKEPRVITTEVPGRGKKVVYYMLYEVINRTGEPQRLIPEFTLRTLDKFTTHVDEVLPKVQKAIAAVEDPTGRLGILNPVQLTIDPILPTPQDSAPRAVRGVAIWPDVFDKAPDTNQFSIFVGGLSDGVFEGEDGIIRRKTLQLNFLRRGDAREPRADQIEFVDSTDPWMYRATSVNLGEAAPDQPEPEPGLID